MMGGTITVKSEEGQGSEFTVNLTFKLCGEAKSYEKIEQLQGLKVLVADDDTDTCLSISGMLTEIGYAVRMDGFRKGSGDPGEAFHGNG